MILNCGVILVFCIFVSLIFAEKCRTPNNEEAECRSLYSCITLIDALRKQTPEATDFVRNSNCGGTFVEPKVCCGSFSGLKVIKKPEDNLLADRRYCGYQHADDYNHHNKKTNIDEFPWLAVVNFTRNNNKNETVICGGSLINNRYVLTAAHCLLSTRYTATAVQLGDYHAKNISDCVITGTDIECSKAERFGIEETVAHSDYNENTSENDIGLIRLDREVYYSDYIRPICLPAPGRPAAKPGDIVKITGFGRVNFLRESVEIKKKVLSKLVTHEECTKEYEATPVKVTDNNICSVDLATNEEFSCSGDSGSPVMFSYRNQWQQEGIVSFSIRCGDGRPDLHVKVVNYINWIRKNIKV